MADRSGWLTTARLSPLPSAPRPCNLPYGLGWEDLRDCLPGFTTPVGARAWIAHDKQGIHGGDTSCILTLGYQTADGYERTETVFVKQTVDPAKAEGARYRFLEQRGIALPRLLASVDIAPGEVIVLEFLPTIGVRPQDADNLVHLIARLNALARPPIDLFPGSEGMPMAVFDRKVVEALAVLADDPSVDVVDGERWFDAYKSAERVVARLPVALNHGELAFGQIGRTASGLVVLFDLETAAVLPRFTDVAALLARLADLSGRDQRDLFCRYLIDVTSLTGTAFEEEGAWTELLAVRVVSSVQSLPWSIEMAGNPDVGFEPESFARALAADLGELGARS